MQLPKSRSYPKGNFGWNQLLEDSISLSPLYASLRINLHVRIPSSLHQDFSWLRPAHAKFAFFRVAGQSLQLKSRAAAQRSVDGAPALAGGLPPVTFIAPSGFQPKDSRQTCPPWSVLQDGASTRISCGPRRRLLPEGADAPLLLARGPGLGAGARSCDPNPGRVTGRAGGPHRRVGGSPGSRDLGSPPDHHTAFRRYCPARFQALV